jgi:hypothetical protein
MLSITERETSVMLIDCAKMSGVWSLEDARTLRRQKPLREKTRAAGLWGPLSGDWNACDFEYEPGRAKLLHFTILHMQPWKPFPRQLKYQPNPLEALWLDMERAADQAGFMVFTRSRPSRRFQQMSVNQHVRMPLATPRQRSAVESLAIATGARDIARYDVASGDLVDYPGAQCRITAAGGTRSHADGIVGVLGNVPGDDVPWVLEEMFAAATKFVFVIAPRPLSFLQRGASRFPADWWRSQIDSSARRHPGIRWSLDFGVL